MNRLFLLILLCIFSFQPLKSNAQNKYAIIVGINDYYKAKTLKSEHSLKGCVNDALGIKSLLKNRFNFQEKNINTLLNDAATQENLINTFNEIIAKSKAGDAVVFYYSGHGTFMNNSALDNDEIKRGYNQSLVMSDLYSKDFDCLVRDNTLKKLFNQFVEKKVILTTIFDCCFSGGMSMVFSESLRNRNPYSDDLNSNNPSRDTTLMKSFPFSGLDSSFRAFDMNKEIIRRDTEVVPRPSETPNSKFASLAASENYVRAAEIWDESGVPHGAFTKAILSIYEKTANDISLSKLTSLVDTQINKTQLFTQKPQFALDPNRQQTNLIGLPLQNGTLQAQTVSCISIETETITVDAGYNDGLAIGNILSNKNGNIIITRVYADKANAKAVNNYKFNIADVFTLTDRYKTSKPLIKVYIYVSSLSTVGFMKNFNSEILPLTKSSNYQDYYNWYDDKFTPTFVANLKPGEGNQFLGKANGRGFCILLPIPVDLASKIIAVLEKEQSVQIVKNIKDADKVLYLNYAVKSEGNEKPGFLFNYRSAAGFEGYDIYKFSRYAMDVKSLMLNDSEKIEVAKGIKNISYQLARSKGTHWINTYPKR